MKTSTVALWLALLAACGVAAGGGSVPAKPRVAIVNEVAWHVEVVLGLLYALREYEPTVYVHPDALPGGVIDMGVAAYLAARGDGTRLLPLPQPASSAPPADVVVSVSPERTPSYTQAFIAAAAPARVIAYVHNGDAADKLRSSLLGLHPGVTFLTLAPHVAAAVKQAWGPGYQERVDWALPVYPHTPLPASSNRISSSSSSSEGAAGCSLASYSADRPCLGGFGIQGLLNSQRRNYSRIWAEVAERLGELRADSRFSIHVLGRGQAHLLRIPRPLRPHVKVHLRLQYTPFYARLASNLALVPSFASSAYYESKFSSTVITSLAVGTPMIVDPDFLRAYGFVDAGAVVVQARDESLVDVLLRVLRLPPAELFAARRAVSSLAQRMNERTASVVRRLIFGDEAAG